MKSTIAKVKQFIAFLVACAAAATAAGCAGPEIDERQLSPETFTASIEQEGATKTVLDAKTGTTRQVRWLSNDAIALYGASVAYTWDGAVHNTQNTAYFTGSGATPDGGKYKAYYPATIYDPTTHKLTFSEEQTYGGLSGGKAVVSNLPMYAESETAQLQFRNLCSVLNFQLTGEATDKVTEIVVTTSAAGQYLSGEFTIGGTPASAPTMVMTGSSGSTNTVKLNCGSGVALSSTPVDFFVAIPAQTYAAGTLTITVKDGTKTLATLSNSTATTAQEQFQRNTIYEIAKEAESKIFSVSYNNGTPTSSDGSGTPANGGTITLADGTAVGLPFSVTTNMGFTVTVSVPSIVIGTLPTGSGTFDNKNAPVAISANVASGTSNFTEAEFTVSATKKVKFSPGNLQYQASTNTWRFASHQWDLVDLGMVVENGEVCKNSLASETYKGWFDTFGFGNTGIHYRTGKHYYQPWLRGHSSDIVEETNGSQQTYESYYYGPGSEPLSQADWDWGIANDIYWGTDLIPAETYHMISRTEMNYLMGYTGPSTPGGLRYTNEAYRFMHATLPGGPTRTLTITFTAEDDASYAVAYTVEQPGMSVNGAILFPDGFYANHSALASAYGSAMNPTNSSARRTVTNWSALEAVGCVFLPAQAYWVLPYGLYETAGMRYGHSYALSAGSLSYDSTRRRNDPACVRLVKDASPTSSNGTTDPYTSGGNIGF